MQYDLEITMSKCEKCGQDKAVACQAIAGKAGYIVKGTRREYCPICDSPPEIVLDADCRRIVLVPDDTSIDAAQPVIRADGADSAPPLN